MGKLLEKNIKWIALLIFGIFLISSKSLNFFSELFSPKSGVDEKNDGGSTISDEAAQIYAESLHKAMVSHGTDEGSIFAIFRYLNNRADYNKVYNSFGLRQYSIFWGNGGDPVTSSKYDLTTWLTHELDPEEIQQLIKSNPQLNIF